ncbi:DUF4352 domain-containing protein [Paenibacillus sp. S-38]|uniref:DUF4352 domain-containing protein n=1 Tax=Paenibacillus sp. S-38 TaxID=3416710 RepID=UPI003CF6D672
MENHNTRKIEHAPIKVEGPPKESKQPVKTPGCLNFVAWSAIILVVIVLMSLGKDDVETTSTYQPTPEEVAQKIKTENEEKEKAAKAAAELEAKKKAEEEKAANGYALGETGVIHGHKVKVNSIRKESRINEFEKPAKGKEFVIVSVTIENGSNEEISYDPWLFDILNSQGQITNPHSSNLETGKLIPGGKVTGELVFEQPIGDPKLQVIYKWNLFSKETIKLNLQ